MPRNITSLSPRTRHAVPPLCLRPETFNQDTLHWTGGCLGGIIALSPSSTAPHAGWLQKVPSPRRHQHEKTFLHDPDIYLPSIKASFKERLRPFKCGPVPLAKDDDFSKASEADPGKTTAVNVRLIPPSNKPPSSPKTARQESPKVRSSISVSREKLRSEKLFESDSGIYGLTDLTRSTSGAHEKEGDIDSPPGQAILTMSLSSDASKKEKPKTKLISAQQVALLHERRAVSPDASAGLSNEVSRDGADEIATLELCAGSEVIRMNSKKRTAIASRCTRSHLRRILNLDVLASQSRQKERRLRFAFSQWQTKVKLRHIFYDTMHQDDVDLVEQVFDRHCYLGELKTAKAVYACAQDFGLAGHSIQERQEVFQLCIWSLTGDDLHAEMGLSKYDFAIHLLPRLRQCLEHHCRVDLERKLQQLPPQVGTQDSNTSGDTLKADADDCTLVRSVLAARLMGVETIHYLQMVKRLQAIRQDVKLDRASLMRIGDIASNTTSPRALRRRASGFDDSTAVNITPASYGAGVIKLDIVAKAIVQCREEVAKQLRQREMMVQEEFEDNFSHERQRTHFLDIYDRFQGALEVPSKVAPARWSLEPGITPTAALEMLKELGIMPARTCRHFEEFQSAWHKCIQKDMVTFSSIVMLVDVRRHLIRAEQQDSFELVFRAHCRVDPPESLSVSEAAHALVQLRIMPQRREHQGDIMLLITELSGTAGRLNLAAFTDLCILVQERLAMLQYEAAVEFAMARGLLETDVAKLWDDYHMLGDGFKAPPISHTDYFEVRRASNPDNSFHAPASPSNGRRSTLSTDVRRDSLAPPPSTSFRKSSTVNLFALNAMEAQLKPQASVTEEEEETGAETKDQLQYILLQAVQLPRPDPANLKAPSFLSFVIETCKNLAPVDLCMPTMLRIHCRKAAPTAFTSWVLRRALRLLRVPSDYVQSLEANQLAKIVDERLGGETKGRSDLPEEILASMGARLSAGTPEDLFRRVLVLGFQLSTDLGWSMPAKTTSTAISLDALATAPLRT